MNRPNFSEWCKRPQWTMTEAAHLVTDVEPPVATKDGINLLEGEAIANIYSRLKSAVENGNLPSVTSTEGELHGRWLKAEDLIGWAKRAGQKIPDELMICNLQQQLSRTQEERDDAYFELFSALKDLEREADAFEREGKRELAAVLRMYVHRTLPKKVHPRTADPAARPLKSVERNSLLIVIAALCKDAGIDLRERGSAKKIEMMTEALGARVTDDTIRKVLSQVPDVVELRGG